MSDNPLIGDASRNASDSLGGYIYQVWNSVYAWITLDGDSALYLERAEDFDIVTKDEAISVQIKCTAANITLRSASVCEAINNFWSLRVANPGRRIRFRYLTTSAIGQEQDNPFDGRPGLSVWNYCRGDVEDIRKLVSFLTALPTISSDLKSFLCQSSPDNAYLELVSLLYWEVDSPDSDVIVSMVQEKLVLHGEKQGVTPELAKKVAPPLLVEILRRASIKNSEPIKRVDFLELFSTNTTVNLPQSAFFAGLSTANLNRSPRSTDQTIVPAQTDFQRIEKGGHRSYDTYTRKNLLSEAKLRLASFGVVFFIGTSGMGKTTTAYQLVEELGGEHLWCHLRMVTGDRLYGTLRELAIQLDNPKSPETVVVDDIDLSPAQAYLCETQLSLLFEVCLRRRIKLILTTQHPVPSQLRNRFGLNDGCSLAAENFTGEEITDYLRYLGCQSDIQKDWSLMILANTSGHPQLVQVMISKLKSSSWPPPTSTNLVIPSAEVVSEKSYVRKRLIAELDAPTRTLLYRLSTIPGPFRRDQATAIGTIAPAIPLPGDQFDVLCGPWLERLSDRYYQLSALVQHSGRDAYSCTEYVTICREIGRSIASIGGITLLEMSNLLLLAIESNDTDSLQRVVVSLMAAPESARETINTRFAYLPWLCTDSTKFESDFAESFRVRFLFRMLQLRVSVDAAPQQGANLTRLLDSELRLDDTPTRSTNRCMFLLQTLLYYQIPLPIVQVVKFAQEFEQLMQHPEHQDLANSYVDPLERSFSEGISLGEKLAVFTLMRCDNYERLDEFLECLITEPEEIRKLLLSPFQCEQGFPAHFANRIWLHEAERQVPNWEATLQALRKLYKSAIVWGSTPLAEHAARSVAVVQEEYLGDFDAAIATVQSAINDQGLPSQRLYDEWATILFHKKDYAEALEIWRRIAEEWTIPTVDYDSSAAFSFGKAAIAAGRLQRWEESHDFFIRSIDFARGKEHFVYSIGSKADAAYCIWKAGGALQAVRLLYVALNELKALGPRLNTPQGFVLQKLIGQTILWLKSAACREPLDTIAEPRIGMCSDPGYSKDILSLPQTEMDYLWVHLLEIEHNATRSDEIYTSLTPYLQRPQFQYVGTQFLWICVGKAIRNNDLSGLLEKAARWEMAMSRLKEAHQQELTGEAFVNLPYVEKPIPDCLEISSPFNLIAGLLAEIADKPQPSKVLGIWSRPSNRTLGPAIRQWIADAQELNTADEDRAISILVDTNEPTDRRLLAAVSLCRLKPSPRELLYAHATVTDQFKSLHFANIEYHFAEIVSRQWLASTTTPQSFMAPRHSVPAIIAACTDSNTSGRRRVGRVLIAASQAVRVRIPAVFIDTWKQWVE